jgi:hypothetical protein
MMFLLGLAGLAILIFLLSLLQSAIQHLMSGNQTQAAYDQQTFAEGRHGVGERQVSVDDMPIKKTFRKERFQNIIDMLYRFLFFVVAFIGLIAAGCIAGLPATTCYALADAYTIALENIGFYGILPIMFLYFGISAIDIMNKEEQAAQLVSGNWIKGLPLIVITSLVWAILIIDILSLSQNGVKNVRLAIDHCFAYTAEHEQNLHDKIPLYPGPFAVTRSLHRGQFLW